MLDISNLFHVDLYALISSWDCRTCIGSNRLFIRNEHRNEVFLIVAYAHVFMLQAFSGTQNVSNQQKEEAWRVNVQIQGIDLEHGYLCGTMEALNVPMADTPVSPYTLTCLLSSCYFPLTL